MQKLIINTQTGEETLREFTKAEKEQQKIDEAAAIKFAAAKAKAEADKAALLARLGISEDEAKLLLS